MPPYFFRKPPFWSKDVFEMYEKIQNDQPVFPEKFDAKAKDLILKLLDKNDKTRLGSTDVICFVANNP